MCVCVCYVQSKDAEVMLKLGSTPDKREQYRIMRDAMEKRFIRVTRGSIIGGIRLGMFTAAFFGFQNLLAENRGVHDVYNLVGAGSATASAFGLICKCLHLYFVSQKCLLMDGMHLIFCPLMSTVPGSLRWRLRNAMLGSVMGATICFPLGNN